MKASTGAKASSQTAQLKPGEKNKNNTNSLPTTVTEILPSKADHPNPQAANKPKPKRTLLKLDDKTLLYHDNGLKKFYEIITKTDFKEKSSDENNLNKLISLYRNWHFMLFPKYDIDYFSTKIQDIGRKASGRAYMSRLRKIYKGEENWDVMYNDQEMILGKGHKNKSTQLINSNSLPVSKGENPNPNANLNSIQNKLRNVTLDVKNKIINQDEERDIQDLILENLDALQELNPQNNINNEYQVNEKDYQNFEERSPSSSIKSTEKRTFTEAFGAGGCHEIFEGLPEDEKGNYQKKLK